MKKFFLPVLFLCTLVTLYAQTTIDRFIGNPALRHASVGISVMDLETGRVVHAHNAEQSLTPASVLKVLTTATALEILGDGYRYKTDVALDADDASRILVLGSGDPTLGSSVFNGNTALFFSAAADALKKALPSVHEAYSLYVVDDLFGYEGVSPEWTWIDLGNYYAPATYGISIFDNSYKIIFNTANRNGRPTILRTEPSMKHLTFHNELTLNNSGRDNGYIYGAPFANERYLRGDIPAGRSEFSIKGDIPDPGLLLGETLARYLNAAGVHVGEVLTARGEHKGGVPNKENSSNRVGNVLFSQVSPPLKDIIREVNVHSNNHYAEHLIRTVGAVSRRSREENALEAGTKAVVDLWNNRGVSVLSLNMHDGSGLAPQNWVSPRLLTEVLVYMYNKSDFSSAFFNSLPKAGEEGTLRYFLRNSRLSGKVYAKSGSIGGVQCYSGYLLDGNKKYAFTVMVNKFNGTRSQVRGAIEQLLLGF